MVGYNSKYGNKNFTTLHAVKRNKQRRLRALRDYVFPNVDMP